MKSVLLDYYASLSPLMKQLSISSGSSTSRLPVFPSVPILSPSCSTPPSGERPRRFRDASHDSFHSDYYHSTSAMFTDTGLQTWYESTPSNNAKSSRTSCLENTIPDIHSRSEHIQTSDPNDRKSPSLPPSPSVDSSTMSLLDKADGVKIVDRSATHISMIMPGPDRCEICAARNVECRGKFGKTRGKPISRCEECGNNRRKCSLRNTPIWVANFIKSEISIDLLARKTPDLMSSGRGQASPSSGRLLSDLLDIRELSPALRNALERWDNDYSLFLALNSRLEQRLVSKERKATE